MQNAASQRGSDADPEIIPAADTLTEPARDEPARRRAGRSKKQWKADKAQEKLSAERAERAEQALRAATKEGPRSSSAGGPGWAARLKAAEIGKRAREARLKHRGRRARLRCL